MNNSEIVLAIQQELDGVEWTPATLERIADILVHNGYRVRDLNDVDRPTSDERLPDGSYLSEWK